jgi:hypothetical protein
LVDVFLEENCNYSATGRRFRHGKNYVYDRLRRVFRGVRERFPAGV